MSDEPNPAADFLVNFREQIAAGKSAYGDAGSPAAQAKLAELDAKIGLGRQLGEIAPAPEPWSIERAAAERLLTEFPAGELQPIHEDKAAAFSARFDQLDALDDFNKARRADQVAKEIGDKPPEFAVGMILDYRRAHGAAPSGHALTELMLVAAEPAVRDAAEDPADTAELMKVLRLDRSALEYFAARGQRMTARAARAKELGLT